MPGKYLEYSLEEKGAFVRAILENSVFRNGEYYGLVTEVLMQIPVEVLEKLDSVLDHIVILTRGTYATAECIHFTCVEKHQTRVVPTEQDKESSEVVVPVGFQRYVIILGLDDMKKLTQAQKLAVIAEEFARVYLECNAEKEVEKLVESWGFRPFSPPSNSRKKRGATSLVQAGDF